KNIYYYQEEDGIRYFHVTGVQTCALPISEGMYLNALLGLAGLLRRSDDLEGAATLYGQVVDHRRSMPEPDAMALAVSLNNLAVTRRMQGRFEDPAAL